MFIIVFMVWIYFTHREVMIKYDVLMNRLEYIEAGFQPACEPSVTGYD